MHGGLKSQKCLIQYCERSELHTFFSGQFLKPEAYGQTVLPDRSILIGQKLVENAKIKYSNATFWVVFKLSVMVSFWRGNRQIEKLPKSC